MPRGLPALPAAFLQIIWRNSTTTTRRTTVTAEAAAGLADVWSPPRALLRIDWPIRGHKKVHEKSRLNEPVFAPPYRNLPYSCPRYRRRTECTTVVQYSTAQYRTPQTLGFLRFVFFRRGNSKTETTHLLCAMRGCDHSRTATPLSVFRGSITYGTWLSLCRRRYQKPGLYEVLVARIKRLLVLSNTME